MTKEEATKFAPIIKAYSEGKTIQFIGEDGKWHDFTCEDVVFADDPNEYRIKPEAKYRPFANAQECWEEMQKHQPFGWIQDIGGDRHAILSVILDEPFTDKVLVDGKTKPEEIDIVYAAYTFADGKPFGIADND